MSFIKNLIADHKEEIIDKPMTFKKFLRIMSLKVYLIHHYDWLLEVYHFHQCNDRR